MTYFILALRLNVWTRRHFKRGALTNYLRNVSRLPAARLLFAALVRLWHFRASCDVRLSPERAPKQTSADHSKSMGSRPSSSWQGERQRRMPATMPCIAGRPTRLRNAPSWFCASAARPTPRRPTISAAETPDPAFLYWSAKPPRYARRHSASRPGSSAHSDLRAACRAERI